MNHDWHLVEANDERMWKCTRCETWIPYSLNDLENARWMEQNVVREGDPVWMMKLIKKCSLELMEMALG
jgi:hypothetical protein